MSFFQELKTRWAAETPIFFKKIINVGVGLGGIGGGLVAPTLAPSVHWPEILVKIGSHMLVIGSVAASVAKFACADQSSTAATQSNNQKP